MKKRGMLLAVLAALVLLCACTAKQETTPQIQPEPAEREPVPVRVTTFTATIEAASEEALTVAPDAGGAEYEASATMTVKLAEGLVPCGADGWPISVSELTSALRVDITYLGDITPGNPAQVLAVAIRVVPTEQPTPTQPTQTTPAEPEPEPVNEPIAPTELAVQDPVPAEIAYEGVTHYGFPCVRTEILSADAIDLDGCGEPETVQLLRIWDQYEQQSFILRIEKDGEVFDTGMVENITYPPSFNAHVWVADLDADLYPEIYFCGDMASDDYVLNVWSMKSGTPELVPIDGEQYLEASILDISDGSIQLESTQSVLGSYEALRAYTLRDGELVPLGDAWQIVPANTSYSKLSVVKELPVTLDDGTESVFAPGTVLQVTGTDGKSFADVITDEGVTGRIYMEQHEGDWQWYIDGESELSYFELVPYAG